MSEAETNKSVPKTEQGAVQQDPELTAEEKLAERERLLSDREKALEQRERTEFICSRLKEKGLPVDLSEFIGADNEEQAVSKIERLEEILRSSGYTSTSDTSQLPIVNTGGNHNRGKAPSGDTSDFIKGLKY